MTTETLNSTGRKLLSGSVLRLVNLFLSAVTSFFLMPFIVHHLGDRLYGFWSLAAAFIGYYGLLDFGFSSAVSQYLCIAIAQKNHEECRSVFNSAVRIQSFLGGLALLLTVGIAAAAPWFCKSPEDAALFWKVIAILGVNMAISFPFRVYSGLLEAELRFDIQAGLGILSTLLRTGLVVWAILQGGGLLALSWMTLAASLPVIALQVWFARRQVPWARIGRSSLDAQRAKRFFKYSIYTFLAVIGDIFRFQLDSVVIAGVIGLVAVTHYRVASVFSRYYIDIVISIIALVQPVLSRLYGAQDRVRMEKVLFFSLKVSMCCSVFVGFSLIAWGKPFIACWMGPNYKDAYWPLVVLTLAILLDVCQCPSISLLYATFNHRFYTYLNGLEGIINLAVSLALARPLGVLGVALGTLIGAFVVRLVAFPIWVCRATGLQYGEYMKLLAGTFLRCACIMGVAIAVSAWGLRPSYPWLVSSAALATLVYAVLSYFLVFTGADRETLLVAARLRPVASAELATLGAVEP